ncbi:MAG TPA: LytTR family DNA-binding domain-containing protein [Usitatibacteraceae bacterium]|nr:LytTR family DNA-binding domain-containing protein [Usitatibacteraceae bacterium]
MNPTAIIADDEQHLAAYLNERLAALWPELSVVGIARNGLEAMKLMDDEAPAIAFLDIRMPGLTGLEVAARLDKRTHVVFVTAYDQYAVEAFDRQAADYLLKPVTDERLERAIARLKERLASSQAPGDVAGLLKQLTQLLPSQKNAYLRFIRAAHGEVVRQIPVEDVLYLQAQDKYVSVYTRDGESLIRTPLSELCAQLDPNEFWQIHRSVIVNVHRVAATRRDVMGKVFVKLRDAGTELPVSRAYLHLFKGM